MTRRFIDKCDACGQERDLTDRDTPPAGEPMGALYFMFGSYDLCTACLTKAAAAVGLKPIQPEDVVGGLVGGFGGRFGTTEYVGADDFVPRHGRVVQSRVRPMRCSTDHLRPVPDDDSNDSDKGPLDE